MHIFKYTDHHALDVIRDCRVKVSEPHRLNDPFELSPRIDPNEYTIEWALESLQQDHIIEDFFKREGHDQGFRNLADYKRWHLQNLQSIAEKRLPSVPGNVEAVQQTFAEGASCYWRIFCASRRRDSILMWSHYAKNHEGALIELDSEEPNLFHADGEFTVKVEYKNEKPSFVHSRDVGQFREDLLRVAGTKSLDWQYEEEVRLVFAKTDCVQDCFVPIARSAVKSVIFGCRSPSAFRAQILDFLTHGEYKHVAVYQAALSKTRYELEFEPIKR